MVNKSLNSNRMFYLDNLKIFLTILVILHHVAIAFGGEGGFIIRVPGGSEISKLVLTAFLAINQSYFMGMFFTISAFFSYKSIRKRGRISFIKGRMQRLVLPAIVYLLLINPILHWIINKFHNKLPQEGIYDNLGLGALWFIAALALFDIIYASILFKNQNIKKEIVVPSYIKSIAFSIIIAIIAWLVKIVYRVGEGIDIIDFQPAHFPQYIFAYWIGITASKYDWLRKFDTKKYKWLMLIGLLLVIVFFVGVAATIAVLKDISYAFGGFNAVSLFYSIWEQVMFITFLFGLVSVFKEYFNTSNTIINIMSQSAYLTYIVHSGIIMTVVMLLSPLNLSYNLYLILVSCLSVVLSFTCGYWLKPIFKL